MSKVEACRHRGMSRAAADYHAKRDGIQFTYKGNGSDAKAKQVRAMGLSDRFSHLTEKQLEVYNVLRKAKYRAAEAMAAVEGRA
jgi:hypothetical protein